MHMNRPKEGESRRYRDGLDARWTSQKKPKQDPCRSPDSARDLIGQNAVLSAEGASHRFSGESATSALIPFLSPRAEPS